MKDWLCCIDVEVIKDYKDKKVTKSQEISKAEIPKIVINNDNVDVQYCRMLNMSIGSIPVYFKPSCCESKVIWQFGNKTWIIKILITENEHGCWEI